MAISVSKVAISINGSTYETEVSDSAASFENLPLSLKGKTVTIASVTATGGTAPYTASSVGTLTAPFTSQTITVTDSATPTAGTATFTLTVDLADGSEDLTTVKDAGWFKFKRRLLNVNYKTGGVVLPGARVKEILAIESPKIVAYTFDPSTRKVKLYTATNTEASNNTDYELSVLCILE